jgi:colicin import membrane protein
MMTRRLRIIVSLIAAAATLLAQAKPGREPEHERIAAERAAVNARFAEQERACQEKFVVTACVDAARKEQRQTLMRLKRAETVLDEAERRETAARRRQVLQERGAVQGARASGPAAEARQPLTRNPPAPNPTAVLPPHRPASSAAEQRAAEQRNEAAFEARARAAQAHRDTVARRNAQRASEGKVGAPLPVPSSASAP